jgi:predicted phage tail protein
MAPGGILPHSPALTYLAQVIQLAVAPVFLLAGLGSFLNVCTGRLARIVDRARSLETDLLASKGKEHVRLMAEMHILDRRIGIVNAAIFATVLAALIISAVVVLLFAGFLSSYRFGNAVALLFIAAMISTATGFAIFLAKTRMATRTMRVRAYILEHQPPDRD